MADTTDYGAIRARLTEILEPAFAGIEVEAEHSRRWKRLMLTFRHPQFKDLLPEQRFRRLVQLVSPDFYEEQLKGAVWFELAPGETIDDLLTARRSEDVEKQEPGIVQTLLDVGFFDALKAETGESPIEACNGDFAATRKVLAAKGITGEDADTACLVFIRNEAYCDCEVLLVARPKLEKS